MGWSDRRANYEIVIRSDGSLVGINPLGDKKNPRFMRVPTVPSRTRGIVPACLYEKADYTLGRKEQAHTASVQSHGSIPRTIDGIEAVQAFLATANTLELSLEQLALVEAGGFGVFRLEGMTAYAHESKDFKVWWGNRVDHARWWHDIIEGTVIGQCSVTGQIGPITRVHSKIKGVIGTGSPPEAPLVSVNISAARYCGTDKGYVSNVSMSAAHKYVTALNKLLSDKNHRRVVGRDTWTWWTDKPSMAGTMLSVLLGGTFAITDKNSVQDAALITSQRELMSSLLRGTKPPEIDGKVFLLGMRGGLSRIGVVFWDEIPTDELFRNVTRHLKDMGEDDVSVKDIALASVHYASSFSPSTNDIIEAILQGTQYPLQLLQGCLDQLRTESIIREKKDIKQELKVRLEFRYKAQISLIRAYLSRTEGGICKMEISESYQMGRLMAALDFIALKAIKRKTGAYATAMFSPAYAIPQQRRAAEHRIEKIGGLGVYMTRLIQDITINVSDFPSYLSLGDQGRFTLGYDHQMTHLYSGEAFAPYKTIAATPEFVSETV
jgi:CRISPR-associated protein Csd1